MRFGQLRARTKTKRDGRSKGKTVKKGAKSSLNVDRKKGTPKLVRNNKSLWDIDNMVDWFKANYGLIKVRDKDNESYLKMVTLDGNGCAARDSDCGILPVTFPQREMTARIIRVKMKVGLKMRPI